MKAGSVRIWWPGNSTHAVHGPRLLSCSSPPRRRRATCSRASSSATPGGPSPTPSPTASGGWRPPGRELSFLDEIGDVPFPLQATFLRVLQDRRFARVGETAERAFEARVVATTQYDLAEAIRHGRFREDLYHRVAGATIEIPPLRERPEDLAPLAMHLLGGDGVLSPGALTSLQRHTWPGNVRELDHVLRAARLDADDGEIDEVHIKTALGRRPGARDGAPFPSALADWVAPAPRARSLVARDSERTGRRNRRAGSPRGTIPNRH